MYKVQIIEDESLLKYADFSNCRVWLLNRTTDEPLDPRVIDHTEITQSFSSNAEKFPLLFTKISDSYPPVTKDVEVKEPVFNEDGSVKVNDLGEPQFEVKVVQTVELGFTYEVYTNDKSTYYIQACVCDESAIKSLDKSEEETTEPQAEQP